jgi:hypothetical protein
MSEDGQSKAASADLNAPHVLSSAVVSAASVGNSRLQAAFGVIASLQRQEIRSGISQQSAKNDTHYIIHCILTFPVVNTNILLFCQVNSVMDSDFVDV